MLPTSSETPVDCCDSSVFLTSSFEFIELRLTSCFRFLSAASLAAKSACPASIRLFKNEAPSARVPDAEVRPPIKEAKSFRMFRTATVARVNCDEFSVLNADFTETFFVV